MRQTIAELVIYLAAMTVTFGIVEILYIKWFNRKRTKKATIVMLLMSASIIALFFRVTIY